ncbi:bacterial protein of unknown function (Gcw_chp) [mine drainage metagenome]|uniref:Uncharacterized protein n=1 Tax=mine drainage metagenome TaxID=410659 RepID=A0A1J5S8K9_9ZZZZ
MTKFLNKSVLLGLFVAASCTLARADQTQSSYSVTLDFPYTSKYVFRGLERANGAQSIQPSVELATRDFYAGIWSNQPVTRHADNEFDFYSGYKLKLADAWHLDTGATLYYYPELARGAGSNTTTEGFLGLVGNFAGFAPGLYSFYDFTLQTFTVQGQLGYSVPIPQAGLSVDLSAYAGHVSPKHGGDYSYWSLGANLPFRLNDKATFYVGVSYTDNNLALARGHLVSFTTGLTVGF